MTVDFPEASRVERLSDQRFTARIPAGWEQGRGAFGGLVMGVLARALEASEPEARKVLRSLSGEIVAPVLAGDAAIDVEIIRRGSGTSTLSAKLRQGAESAEIVAHATAVMGRARAYTRTWTELAPPAPPPFDSLPSGVPLPPFAQHFDYRLTGPAPFSGGHAPVASGWVKTRAPLPSLGVAELIAYADAWWPAFFAVETEWRPMATIAFTLQVCIDPATVAPASPFFHRATTLSMLGGFAVELRELWTEDGRLAALNQQTFVVIT